MGLTIVPWLAKCCRSAGLRSSRKKTGGSPRLHANEHNHPPSAGEDATSFPPWQLLQTVAVPRHQPAAPLFAPLISFSSVFVPESKASSHVSSFFSLVLWPFCKGNDSFLMNKSGSICSVEHRPHVVTLQPAFRQKEGWGHPVTVVVH